MSRLGRNYIETGNLIENVFSFLNIRLIAVTDGFDTGNGDGMGAVVASIKNLVSDVYSRDISRKIISAYRTKQRNGEFIGMVAPYGYLKSKENKNRFVVDGTAAPVVRRIFRQYADGVSIDKIVRILDGDGIDYPRKYRYRIRVTKSERYKDSRWGRSAVRTILTNRAYIGDMVQGKERQELCNNIPKYHTDKSEWIVAEDIHEPVVDRELFFRMQGILEERQREQVERREKSRVSKHKEENYLKGLWQKVKEIWWFFWEVDVYDKTEERLSSSDRRWLLYWNFITCMGVAALFLIVVGIIDIRASRQNRRDAEKAMSMIAVYMATATRDEYDDIAQTIRHDLVFSEYGEEIENVIQYISNTAETCQTCMESYPAQALLVCANTGQSYSLDLYDIGESPDSSQGGTIMNFGYDEVSQTSVHITKNPDQKTGYAKIDRGCGIVSVHRMKTLFCDDCIRDILNAVKHQLIEEFFIFDTAKRVFYPVDDDTALQIGNYHLDIEIYRQ